MSQSKKMREYFTGKYTKKEKDSIKIGNKSFNCAMKALKVPYLTRGPTSITRKTSMYMVTLVIEVILVAILDFIQLQTAIKPPPISSLYNEVSHVSTKSLNNMWNILTKEGPVRDQFIELYRSISGNIHEQLSEYFQEFIVYNPKIVEKLTIIFEKLIGIGVSLKDYPRLLLDNMVLILNTLNEVVQTFLKEENVTKGKYSDSYQLFQSQLAPLKTQLSKQVDKHLNYLNKNPLQKSGVGVGVGVGVDVSNTNHTLSQKDDTNAFMCAIKSVLFSSPIVYVVGFIYKFVTYTISKLIEISLKTLLEYMKIELKITELPPISSLFNDDESIATPAFQQLLASILKHKDAAKKFAELLTSNIKFMRDLCVSVAEYYEENVPEPIRLKIHNWVLSFLDVIINIEDIPRLGLQNVNDILKIINNAFASIDPIEINEIIMSIVNRTQESMRAMASQNMQQITTMSSPYVDTFKNKANENINNILPQKEYDQKGLDSSNNNYNILVGGGRKRKTVTQRSLFGGKINKSIRDFYMTNQVHKRTRKRH
jgi:hypothetical protein